MILENSKQNENEVDDKISKAFESSDNDEKLVSNDDEHSGRSPDQTAEIKSLIRHDFISFKDMEESMNSFLGDDKTQNN